MLVDTQKLVKPGGFGSNSIIFVCEPLKNKGLQKSVFDSYLLGKKCQRFLLPNHMIQYIFLLAVVAEWAKASTIYPT